MSKNYFFSGLRHYSVMLTRAASQIPKPIALSDRIKVGVDFCLVFPLRVKGDRLL